MAGDDLIAPVDVDFCVEAGRLGAAEFIEAVKTRLLPVLRRPRLLVPDNGPCHRSRLVKAERADWRRGLRLFLLPPYCLPLNRIETLWRLVKPGGSDEFT